MWAGNWSVTLVDVPILKNDLVMQVRINNVC